MSFDFVPMMYAVQIGLLLILVQLVSAVISWRTGNVGLLLVSSTLTVAVLGGFFASVAIEVLGLPFMGLPVAVLAALNLGGAHAYFAHKGLQRFAEKAHAQPVA